MPAERLCVRQVPILPLADLAAIGQRLKRLGRYPTAASTPDAPAAKCGPFEMLPRLLPLRALFKIVPMYQAFLAING